MGLEPVEVTKQDLLAILKEIQYRIEYDDSFEGTLLYEVTDSEEGTFLVMASFRVGNSQGQGGCTMIGNLVNDEDKE